MTVAGRELEVTGAGGIGAPCAVTVEDPATLTASMAGILNLSDSRVHVARATPPLERRMKIDGTHAALERFKLTRADEDHRLELDPELPDDVGIVHALIARPHDLAFVKPGSRGSQNVGSSGAPSAVDASVSRCSKHSILTMRLACEKCARTLAEPDVDAG